MRLFFLGIGGTGSRVAEALTFLLAAGVKLQSDKGEPVELVPILLDTDEQNGDTLNGASAFDLYRALYATRGSKDTDGFFCTQMQSLADCETKTPPGGTDPTKEASFRVGIGRNVQNVTFRKFIEYGDIDDPATRGLLNCLYSDENFDRELTGGFVGEPNVGAVVLSEFEGSADFVKFANAFNEGDRVFVAGSIFGGTGAAGLPWLVKALRSAGQSAGAALAIRNAAIGALLVLPYFKLVEDTGSPISSSVFITKMKAALGYYAEHLHGFNSVYYLYDSGLTSYQNAPQGKDQNNAAHVIELLGALAAIRFVALKKSECTDTERYYEYAVRVASAQSALGFQNLGAETERQLTKALTQLQMLAILDRDHFVGAGGQRWAKENGFPRAFFSSPEYKGSLSGFLTTYLKWIDELRENKRSFDPFREGISAKAMSTLRTDRVAEPGKLGLRLSGEAFDVAANSIGGSKGGRPGSVAHFLKLSWEATSRMYDTFYGHAH